MIKVLVNAKVTEEVRDEKENRFWKSCFYFE